MIGGEVGPKKQNYQESKGTSIALQFGLLAQLVEHCTGIAEVMGSNPVQA